MLKVWSLRKGSGSSWMTRGEVGAGVELLTLALWLLRWHRHCAPAGHSSYVCCGTVSCGAVQGWYSWDVKWVFWLFVLIEAAVQQTSMRSSVLSPSFSWCTYIRLAEGSIRIQVSVSLCCSFLSESIKVRFSFMLSPLAMFWQHKDALTRM